MINTGFSATSGKGGARDSQFVRFCVMQFAFWAYWASFGGYVSALMLSCGLSESKIGLILSFGMVTMMASSLVWGRVVDTLHANKRYYLLGLAATLILSLLCWRYAGNERWMALFYSGMGFFQGALSTTLDAWVMALYPENPNFGAKSRGFGTLGYALSMLLTGQLVQHFGFRMMPVLMVMFTVLSLAVGLTQKEVPQKARGLGQRKEESGNGGEEKVSPKLLLKNGIYVLLVLGILFTGLAVGPLNNLKALVLDEVGAGVDMIGWDSFIGCMVQVPLMINADRVSRHIRMDARLLLGSLMNVLYVLFVLLAQNAYLIILGTICNNISYAMIFPAMREMVERTVRPQLRNTAHGITDIAYNTLCGVIAASTGGVIMQYYGKGLLCIVCMAMQAAGIALFMALKVRYKKERG